MKGLAYYRVNRDDPNNAGVVRKMEAQVAALRASGLTVDLVCLGDAGIYLNDELLHPFRSSVLGNALSTYLFYLFRWPAIVQQKVDLTTYDFLYLRYPMMHPLLMRFLRRARRAGLRIALEIPTWPYDKEPKRLPHRMSLQMDRLYRSGLKEVVDRILHYGMESHIYGVPTISLRNGVEIDQIPFFPRTPISDSLRLIAVANWSYWHGLDRLLHGLAKYYREGPVAVRVQLQVVGGGPEQRSYRALTKRLGLEQWVRFVPAARGRTLDQYFATADLGIGTLGMHRKGVEIDSSLKHREYCARGLAFVLSRQDTDFPPNWPYTCYVEDSDASIDIPPLIDFFQKLPPDASQNMRAYAKERLSWHQQLQPFVQWLRSSP
ncbi:MAG: glycosyltransferase [Bacteroidota bacterium]